MLRSALVLLLIAGPQPSSPVLVEELARETEDGPLRGWIARVDLRDPRVSFVTTAPAPPQAGDPTGTEARLEPTDAWARREGVLLAVNGGFFGRLGSRLGTPGGWVDGEAVDVVGLARSDGRPVSPPRRDGEPEPALLVDEADGRSCPCTVRPALATERSLEGVEEAVAGMGPRNGQPGTLLVEGGENRGSTAQVAPAARHPRTVAGVTRDGRTLMLVVVDGRQPGWSLGATLPELAALMIEAGAWNAVNLDGGGSTTMWRREPGEPGRVLNRPSDGRARPVANHLGVRVGGGAAPARP